MKENFLMTNLINANIFKLSHLQFLYEYMHKEPVFGIEGSITRLNLKYLLEFILYTNSECRQVEGYTIGNNPFYSILSVRTLLSQNKKQI